ncbi:MAG: 50S ribosomal protein L15 [Simkaniaceae bacterium]
MITLSSLKNTTREKQSRKRVGRGTGSKKGKTSCRGHKGDKSRSGYKRRHGKEGGQLPLYQKLPTRGFLRERFREHTYSINLERIESLFEDGETVNYQTLREKRMVPRKEKIQGGIKILGNGELTKKVVIEANAFSKAAIRKLEEKKIEFKIL